VTADRALGPLDGVPFSVDMVAVEGMRLTFGSYMFEHNVADHDAVAVQRLEAAGGIPIGMTAMGEFGHKGFNDSPLWGVTRNPWKLDRTTGGSSGGDRGGYGPTRHRHRLRRLGAHTGELLRHRRTLGAVCKRRSKNPSVNRPIRSVTPE
jgi:hypothetical protein